MFRWHLSTKTEIRFFPLKLRFESDPSPLLLIQFRISRTKVLPLLGQSSLKSLLRALGNSYWAAHSSYAQKPTDMSLESPGRPRRGLLLEQTRSELI